MILFFRYIFQHVEQRISINYDELYLVNQKGLTLGGNMEKRIIDYSLSIDNWIEIGTIINSKKDEDMLIRLQTYLEAHSIAPYIYDINVLLKDVNSQEKLLETSKFLKEFGVKNIHYTNNLSDTLCVLGLGNYTDYTEGKNYKQIVDSYVRNCYTDGIYEEISKSIQPKRYDMVNINEANYLIVEKYDSKTKEILESNAILKTFAINLPLLSKNPTIYTTNGYYFQELSVDRVGFQKRLKR